MKVTKVLNDRNVLLFRALLEIGSQEIGWGFTETQSFGDFTILQLKW